ncbi:prepilin peptidase [Arthrobacter nitrophenolicus]|uniref:Prepilin peptidase n=1 Tax=Arthrobacter nitrophenolicus TaxID=683150 RepID=A0A4R5YBH6_9MICC|nr:prepilin peptidase [Arthrobacter nitrophenolicus]TDL41386.1 prepilin peptidase [Arthrobacter nitrophenolicus]
MLGTGYDGSANWIVVVGIGLLGITLSPFAEVLIAKQLPRLGGLPTTLTRMTTAAMTGFTCASFALRFGIGFELPAFIFLAVLGVQLARIDIEHHLLPNPLVLALLTGGLLLLLASGIFNQQADDLLRGAFGALILFAGYLVLGLISPGGIGMGDIKLAAPVGLYLGYLGWTQVLYGALLGFIVNGLVTLLILSQKRRTKASEVAHGPSMLGALAVATLFIR